MKTFYIRTFGCQMNDHDSERMAQLLVMQGLRPVDSPREADLVIINTCSVRAKPEHKALSEAGRHRQRKQAKGTRILLTGCVAQQEGDRLLSKAPYLDAIIGPDAVGRLPEILASIQAGNGPVIAVDLHDKKNPCFVPLQREPGSPISSLVTIMKGCDNYCSYCVVPNVRGREVSRPLGDILEEVETLAAGGSREVVLLGQNVNSYHDPDPRLRKGFPELLAALDRQAAVERIRFTTSHPKDLGPRLIEAMAGLERVCEHIHLALQSGSDRILELMNRNYSAADFIGKAEAIRQAMPGVSITTDIIVGFPSESDEDFQNTMETVRSAAFDQAFSFKYSPRPGTAAAKLKDDVSPEEKAERLAVLQTLLDELEAASLSRLSGQTLPVLVEGQSIRDPDALRGRTRCNRVVNFASSSPVPAGKIITVRILEARGHTLWGECGVDNRPLA
jgi:tRNA-2-methylthio-N6-dimethylallyladenosine synthase